MRSKTIPSIVFSSVVLLLFVPHVLAGVADQLQQADNLFKNKQYDQAEQIYLSIAQSAVGSLTGQDIPEAFAAQKSLISLYIKENKNDKADAAYKQLISNFSGNKGIAEAIYNIGIDYKQTGKSEKAYQIHKYNVENFPADMYAMWSQVEIICSHIRDANYSAANTEVDKLLTIFADHPTLSKEVYQVAGRFSEAGNNQKAHQLYQYLIDTWSGTCDIDSRKFVVTSHIALGNEQQAQVQLDQLVADFTDHPDLPPAIFQIGEEYYSKALNAKGEPNLPEAGPEEYYRKAIAIWEIIVTELPKSAITPESYYFSARCYRRLGEYKKAIEFYQKVVDNWPDYQYAGHAQFLIGKFYETLIKSGSLPESEANAKMERAYKAVIEKYPDCTSAKDAWMELGYLNFKRGQWTEAAQCWELSLKKDPENRLPPHILYPLGRAYEEMGQPDKAAQVYREFIKSVDPSDPRIETAKARLEKLGIKNDN